MFDTLRISDVSGVGVRFRDRAYARIVQIDLTRVGGTGISIEDRSYPYIDGITHTDCKGEVLHIEPGAERRKGAKEIIAKLRSDNQRGM